jgi:hypothetical protein
MRELKSGCTDERHQAHTSEAEDHHGPSGRFGDGGGYGAGVRSNGTSNAGRISQPVAVASNSAPSIDKTVVRIRSLPERVVYDTSLPTIVFPATKSQIAAGPPHLSLTPPLRR